MSDQRQQGLSSGRGHHFSNNHFNGAKVHLGDVNHFYRDNVPDPLDRLPYATGARFNSSENPQHDQICLPDTRVDLLQDIYRWADSQDERCIFWLNGLAGTGKSTIARTVARRYFEKHRLGASFFFSKGGGDVSHGKKFFTTIARQIADNVPLVKQHVCGAVSQRKDIVNDSLADQWRELVFKPLSNLNKDMASCSYLVVIDALDECDNEGDVQTILHLLADARFCTSVRLRILLTSRPEVPIRYGIANIPKPEHQDFVLHNIEAGIVNHDISIFLKHNLGITRQKWGLEPTWPSEEALAQLVKFACGLFIWAATAYRFIDEGRGRAQSRLATILEGSRFTMSAPEQHLNKIYLAVLEGSLSWKYTDKEKIALREKLKAVLGSVVTLLSPLSVVSLRNLLQFEETDLSEALGDLHAILDVPHDPTNVLRLHHPSFRDFLLTQDRSREFWVYEEKAHWRLAAICIDIMDQTLKKDILKVQAPGTRVGQIQRHHLEKCLPPEAQYACLYWVQHLQKSDSQLHDADMIHRFLQKHFLHWLEALGWMGKASEGILAIRSLEVVFPVDAFPRSITERLREQLLKIYSANLAGDIKNHQTPRLQDFIHDAKRFALYNQYIIENAPLQLYCSALIFAPARSIVRRDFAKYMPSWVKKQTKVREDWDALQQTFEGHNDSVTSVAFSPDSKLVVSGSWDLTVRLWEATTGKLKGTLKGHNDFVASVIFSPDSNLVISGSWDKTVRLWDVRTNALKQTLEGHNGQVSSVAMSVDGRLVVSGSRDLTVRLWEATSGMLKQTLEGHKDWVNSVAFSPDGKLIVSGSRDKTVRLWDITAGALKQTLKGHNGSVSSVAFSLDGKLVVSGSHDNTVRVWNVITGTLKRTIESHEDWVRSASFSPDSKIVITGSRDKTVRLWDASSGVLKQTLEGHDDWVHSVAFSPDGKLIISGSWDKTVRLWDATTSEVKETLGEYNDHVNSVAFSPDGELVISRSHNNRVQLWDAITGNPKRALTHTLKGHDDWVQSVAFSQDGKLIVSASDDRTVRLWDVMTGALQQTLEGHNDYIYSVAFSPDGKLVVSGAWDLTVRLWDTTTGLLKQTMEGHNDWINSVAFSPDGKLVVSGSQDRTVRLWDIVTGQQKQTIEGHDSWVRSAVFSPDSKLIVSGSGDSTLRLWDVATGKLKTRLQGHNNPVNSVAFSPDGKFVVSGSNDKTVRVWEVATGALKRIIEGHNNCVRSVAYSPDGKFIISGSHDRTVRLWDSTTGALKQIFDGHKDWVRSVAFSPDGKLVVSGSRDKTLRLWDATTDVLQQMLKSDNDLVGSFAFSTTRDVLPILRTEKEWLRNGTTSLIWLPPEYRATCQAVQSRKIAMGHSSGRVSIISLKEARLYHVT